MNLSERKKYKYFILHKYTFNCSTVQDQAAKNTV